MIKHTFSIFDGIGEKTEQRFWREGILSWEDMLERERAVAISQPRYDLVRESVCYLYEELCRKNPEPFATYVRLRDHWRLFERFKDTVACLDIETNGFPPERGGKVTVVGIYKAGEYRALVRGDGLTERSVQEALEGVNLLVTFFGTGFDIPFLKKVYPGLDLRIPHFDLSFAARKLGFKGGLKKIEVQFGLCRSEEVEGMNGYDAVLLWRAWQRGDTGSLEKLVEYNRADTENLFYLAERLYNMLRKATGIERYLNEWAQTGLC